MKWDLVSYNELDNTSIDICHCALISSTVMSHKPKNILELGIGTAFVSINVLKSIDFNKMGHLTSVDNWKDFDSKERYHSNKNWTIITSNEKEFIQNSIINKEKYDLIISDADHANSINWIDQIFEIASENSVLFFHDTNNKNYPSLLKAESVLEKMGIHYFHFKESSLKDERCHRGLLMAFKKSKVFKCYM